jgi:hypothetical protein
LSRGQQGQVFTTGQKQNQSFNNDANTSFNNAESDLSAAQNDVTSYADALAGFKAANPYVQGGQAETAENQSIADTAAGGAQAAGQALQSQAVRTGQNAGGAIAATENIAENNDRNLMGEEAQATESRLGADTGYNQAVLQGTGNVEGMQTGIESAQDQIANQQGQLAEGALSEEEKAAQTPSFMDELGQGLIQAGDNFAGGFGQGFGKAAGCWVAAEVFGGWYEPRTVKVREWVFGPFSEHWLGAKIASLYLRHGERTAALMRTNRAVRWLMTGLCQFALRKASRGELRMGDLE